MIPMPVILRPPPPPLRVQLLSGVLPAGVTFSRAGSKTNKYWDSGSGAYDTYLTDVPLLVPGRGYRVEGQRTNYAQDSTAPATHTTAGNLPTGTYCLWVIGAGSAAVSAGTATLTGAGSATQGTPLVFQVTVTGTVTFTKTGSLDCWQCEYYNSTTPANNPTSLIVTAGASVTRAADIMTMDISGIYRGGGVPQTLYVEAELLAYPYVGAQVAIAGLGKSGSTQDALRIRQAGSSNTINGAALNGASVVSTSASQDVGYGSIVRACLAYTAPGLALTVNGVHVAADTTAILGTGQNTLFLGQPETTANRFDGYLREVRYYPRALGPDERAAETVR